MQKGTLRASPLHLVASRLLPARLMINREDPAKNHSLRKKSAKVIQPLLVLYNATAGVTVNYKYFFVKAKNNPFQTLLL
jgi:hypothetical protein